MKGLYILTALRRFTWSKEIEHIYFLQTQELSYQYQIYQGINSTPLFHILNLDFLLP